MLGLLGERKLQVKLELERRARGRPPMTYSEKEHRVELVQLLKDQGHSHGLVIEVIAKLKGTDSRNFEKSIAGMPRPGNGNKS